MRYGPGAGCASGDHLFAGRADRSCLVELPLRFVTERLIAELEPLLWESQAAAGPVAQSAPSSSVTNTN
jgi:hypothetical protein